ncbi:hypothetical protein ACFQI7_08455 [Paenibacillus allorhizosphaerae]|uniref:Nucleotidyltransferase family protein n=1 Tax=Paenibacillus allorhizosphaerae TaxID=2849866 RepID=A0ABN7TJK1_9BACL|nr:hypothetical protein [Paenibacillus allorhizosphaerae]CAG7639082.1 hypothetical protein PAECIP111802_02505 [Paenibacillus allorhizosphaerae]
MLPDIKNLAVVIEKLEQFHLEYSLGGSGLLHSLGLTGIVRDWDIMTEAPKDRVLEALQNFEVKEIISGDYPFASEYKLLIHDDDPQLEITGRFSIYTRKGLCRIPSLPVSRWNGIHVGSPEAWYVAYALMNRKEKAKLLLSYLKKVGSHQAIINILMNEPLPDEILKEIKSLKSQVAE